MAADGTKTGEFHICIFKQGDDLHHHIEQAPGKDPIQGLRNYAVTLGEAAEQCRTLANRLTGQTVEIDACTHHIGVTAPAAVIDQLVKDEILAIYDDGEDEDEYEEEDDEDDTGELVPHEVGGSD